MLLMGVDVGTTGVKAAVFDEMGAQHAYAFEGYPVCCDAPGCAEQDAELVLAATLRVMAQAAGGCGGGIEGISLSTQGDAVIPVGRDGAALAPAQLGMDYRATEEVAALETAFGAKELFFRTGMRPHPMNSVVKMMWFQKHALEVAARVWKYMTYADFLLFRLGSDGPVMDLTMASRTMALSLTDLRWAPDILNAAGLNATLLSELVEPGAAVGELHPSLCAQLGIHKGARLVAGGHDQTCAALGAGTIGSGLALDSHGTAEVLSAALSERRLDDALFEGFYPCYAHVVPGMFFTFSLNHTAGILLQWYRDNLGLPEVEEAKRLGERGFEQIVKKAARGPSPLLVLPHFGGSGTPTCDAHSKGAILGLTMSSTRHDIAKALMDATAMELRLNLETMRGAGIPIETIRCVGGGARSPIDLQLKADVLGLPVETLETREAACLGAAILAGVGTGTFADVRESAACVRPADRFEPDEEMHARYNVKYGLHKKLYEELRALNHEIAAW